MLLSRRLAGMDDFEQYIGNLLAAHKTFMELEARIDERETIETICRGLLGSRFESIAEKYLDDEDKNHLSALFSDLQERYDRVKDTRQREFDAQDTHKVNYASKDSFSGRGRSRGRAHEATRRC